MKYNVMGIYTITASEEVEAETPEDAIEKAGIDVSLCHQCAREGSLGDLEGHVVVDESNATVYDDLLEAQLREENRELKAKVEELEEKVRKLGIGYSRNKKKAKTN